jgi:filamentous hemagglutinin family protein
MKNFKETKMKLKPEYSSRFRILKGGKISLVVSALLGSMTLSFAAPSGGVVTSGSASISQSGKVTNINQSTQKASINWQKFNVAHDETVNFNQPNVNSITLNRVVGNERSVINGALNANGQVWILNSNGVLFGKNASINTAGLLATTKELSDQDFQAGNYKFTGNSNESVINLGTIDVVNNGSVILAANEVKNEGTIKAIRGKIHLAGADEYTVNLNGNSLINLIVNKGVLDALVKNSGTIIANGGEVYLTTNAVNELLKGVVNNTGVIEANSLAGITGHVELFAHGGEVQVDGKLQAKDGFIETSGREFSINKDAKIEAKEWLIDPVDITIDDALAGVIETTLGTGDVTIETDSSTANCTPSINCSDNETGSYGDIYVASDINYEGTRDGTLTLKAYRNIVFADGYGKSGSYSSYDFTTAGSIRSTNAALNVVLWSRAGDTETNPYAYRRGSVWVPVNSSIITNGGDITIGGGTDPLKGYSYSGSSDGSAEGNAISRGVSINGSLDAQGGNISIKGEGHKWIASRGVSISGSISTKDSGNISIDGISHTASDGIALGDTAVPGTTGVINIENGTVRIVGYSSSYGSSDSFYLNDGSFISSTGTGTLIINGNNDDITSDSTSYIDVSNLLLHDAANITFKSTLNDIDNIAAETVGSLTFYDKDGINIGSTINGVTGITSSGNVDIATLTNDLTLSGNVTGNNIVLNAGKSTAAGTSTGGNIVLSGTPSVTAATGNAILYTGSVSDSTGITELIGSGSGNFRYNSDETTTNYSTALGATGNYAIYREQPTPTPKPTPEPTPTPQLEVQEQKKQVDKVITTIVNQEAVTINPPKVETPNNIGKNVDVIFSIGENKQIVSKPIEGQPTQRITLGQARQMQLENGVSGEEVRVPLSRSSMIELVNGGVLLPDGVEQEFYVAEDL